MILKGRKFEWTLLIRESNPGLFYRRQAYWPLHYWTFSAWNCICIRNFMSLIHVTEVYLGIFSIKHEVCSNDSSFTRSHKRMPIYAHSVILRSMWKIVCNAFYWCYTILHTLVYINKIHFKLISIEMLCITFINH